MAALIGAVTYQAIQLHNRPTANTIRPQSTWQPGVSISNLVGMRLSDGTRQKIDLSGEKILYTFSPKCSWCTKNLANAESVHRLQKSRFIGLSSVRDGLEKYVLDHGITYPVYYNLNQANVSITPSTVVAQDGLIIQSWEGAWGKDNKTRIESYFPGLTLPGVK